MGIEAHLCVYVRSFPGLGIGKENFCGRFGENHVPDGRIHGVGDVLRSKDQGAVAFAEHLEPFPDFLLKDRVAEHDPCLIKNEQGRLSVQGFLDPAEKIEQNRQGPAFLHGQYLFHFKGGEGGQL